MLSFEVASLKQLSLSSQGGEVFVAEICFHICLLVAVTAVKVVRVGAEVGVGVDGDKNAEAGDNGSDDVVTADNTTGESVVVKVGVVGRTGGEVTVVIVRTLVADKGGDDVSGD